MKKHEPKPAPKPEAKPQAKAKREPEDEMHAVDNGETRTAARWRERLKQMTLRDLKKMLAQVSEAALDAPLVVARRAGYNQRRPQVIVNPVVAAEFRAPGFDAPIEFWLITTCLASQRREQAARHG